MRKARRAEKARNASNPINPTNSTNVINLFMIISKNIFFPAFNILLGAIYYGPLKELITLSFRNELYSHIILIPLVSGYFLFLNRKSLLAKVNYSYVCGLTLIIWEWGCIFSQSIKERNSIGMIIYPS